MVKFLKPNFLFLAPMAGFSNSACREICREYGADGVVSEFVYSRAVLSQAEKIMQKIAFTQSERPVGIQIFGSDPCEVADASVLIEEKLSPDKLILCFGIGKASGKKGAEQRLQNRGEDTHRKHTAHTDLQLLIKDHKNLREIGPIQLGRQSEGVIQTLQIICLQAG